MNVSSLDLSAVVLDVDRTLIRSVRTNSSNNPYPYYKSQHIEEYFHFTLNAIDNPQSKELRDEHYHIYIRPGLKKLMTYFHYLQQHTSVKMAIASMAKREYIHQILKGLQKHCTERKFPKFDSVLTRESWDENLSPSSTPTY